MRWSEFWMWSIRNEFHSADMRFLEFWYISLHSWFAFNKHQAAFTSTKKSFHLVGLQRMCPELHCLSALYMLLANLLTLCHTLQRMCPELYCLLPCICTWPICWHFAIQEMTVGRHDFCASRFVIENCCTSYCLCQTCQLFRHLTWDPTNPTR